MLQINKFRNEESVQARCLQLTKRVNPTYNVSNQDDGSEYCKELLYLFLAKSNAVHAVYHHIERCSIVEGRGRREGMEGGREESEGGREGGRRERGSISNNNLGY